MYGYIPLDLNQLLYIGVDQWLQICMADIFQWVYVMVKGLLLFGRLFHATMARYPVETDTCAFVTQ